MALSEVTHFCRKKWWTLLSVVTSYLVKEVGEATEVKVTVEAVKLTEKPPEDIERGVKYGDVKCSYTWC